MSRVAGNREGSKAGSRRRAGRGDPGHDLLVVQALGRGPGGLVDPVPRLGGAVLGAAQRRSQRRVPGVFQQFGGGGRARVIEPPGHVPQRAPGGGGGQQQAGQQFLGGRTPDVALGLVIDGEHEVAGEPVGGLHAGQGGQRVPPPALPGGGDALRVEHPHGRAGGGAQFGGGGPQVGLVAGRDDRSGGRQHVRDAQAGGFARSRPHEGDQGVFPGGVQVRAVPAGLLEAAEHQPDVGGGEAAGPGAGQRGPQPDALLGRLVLGELADRSVPAERGDRVTGLAEAPRDDPPCREPGGGEDSSQDGAGHGYQAGRSTRPRLPGAAVQDRGDPPHAERQDPAAGQGGGQAGGGPREPGQPGQAPRGCQQDPGERGVASGERGPWP